MAVVRVRIQSGTYMDSVLLMQAQKGLREQAGVLDAAVVMGTAANLQLLRQSGLWSDSLNDVGSEDLVVAVSGEDETVADRALQSWDSLIRNRSTASAEDFRPRSLETALRIGPNADLALISVPGRYAAHLAEEALARGLHVFLYSDNVALHEEVRLKRLAQEKGLLLMGPDCGTSIINGVGLGFANRVVRGPVGLVGASGTGLQTVSCALGAAGVGVSQVIGTGGRDLSDEVGAVTTLQGLDLLDKDPETQVLVLVSKPPSSGMTARVLRHALGLSKPVVVALQGYASPAPRLANLSFARNLEEAAQLAGELANPGSQMEPMPSAQRTSSQGYLRALFSGGTLAQETLSVLRLLASPVSSNLDETSRWDGEAALEGHWVLDLGADEFTAGRLHPMLDYELRLRQLEAEAAQPDVGVILLDVVLGHGAHPNPASELAPVISRCLKQARETDRTLEVITLVIGTEGDPQRLEQQIAQLQEAEARVETSPHEAAICAGLLIAPPLVHHEAPVMTEALRREPLTIINLGLGSFGESLRAQGAKVIEVDWSPPAGGNTRLASILKKLNG